MKVIAINGSPRKGWNTATLLEKALEGAASKGAGTELAHLYDLDYKGCISCFACKTSGGKSYGKCTVNDDLKPLFKRIEDVDAVILGSPIYLGTVTGEMRSFLERWVFAYLTYSDTPQTLFPKTIPTAFIYTMNLNEQKLKERGLYDTYYNHFALNETYLKRIFGPSQYLLAMDTYQFEDYSKVAAGHWDEKAKAKRREEVFPLDCQKAFELGVELIKK